MKIDFKKTQDAFTYLLRVDAMSLADLAASFAEYSEQEIPPAIVSDFRFRGLSNIDFLMSDFLKRHSLKNLPVITLEKTLQR